MCPSFTSQNTRSSKLRPDSCRGASAGVDLDRKRDAQDLDRPSRLPGRAIESELCRRSGGGRARLFRPGSAPVPLTLGVGGSPELGWKPVLGLWGGVPVPLFTRPCARDCLGASLVLGYRWAGVHELYFTPKLGLVSGVAYSVD